MLGETGENGLLTTPESGEGESGDEAGGVIPERLFASLVPTMLTGAA